MKVLVNTPDFGGVGGVAAFYHMLRGHLGSNVAYFTIGPRRMRERLWARVCRCLSDGVSFHRSLRRTRPDLVCLNPSLRSRALLRDGLFLLIAKTLRVKVVVFYHGWDPHCEQVIRKRCLWLFRPVFFRADAFIVLSSRFRDCLTEMGYDGPIHVGTTAVEDSFWTPCENPMPSMKGHGGPFRILFLTRIEKAKGIYEALEAYRIVKRDNARAVLTVAGDGSELDGARRHVRDHQIPDVTFTGHLQGEVKRRAFLSSDCYLFPSHSEGMPISVLEAMASGLPVVTSAVGGLRDFFEDGLMGFITESRSPEVYAEHMSRLARDAQLRRQIGRFNRAYAKERFAASKVAARLEGICRDVLAGEVSEKGTPAASGARLSPAGHAS